MSDHYGHLLIDGWAGRREIPVRIIEDLPGKQTLVVQLLEEAMLPSRRTRRTGKPGDDFRVPRRAVRLCIGKPEVRA